MAPIRYCQKKNIICELCGEMVVYGLNRRTKCSVGETQVLQEFEHLYAIIPDEFSEIESSMGFYRRNMKSYGVDLKYCINSEKLTIYARYSMVAVFDKDEILAIVEERAQI